MSQSPLIASPLQLQRYYIKELYFSIKEEFIDKYEQIEGILSPQLTADITAMQGEEDSLKWRFELVVESKDEDSKEFPYSIRIALVGFFQVSEEYPIERATTLAKVNGPSLLYSAAREALVTATSRSGYPAIVLPTVIFAFVDKDEPAPVQPSLALKEGAGEEVVATTGTGKSKKKTQRTAKKK